MELGFLDGRGEHRRPPGRQRRHGLSRPAPPVDWAHGRRADGDRPRGGPVCAQYAGPAGPDGHPQPARQPGAGAAVPRRPQQPPQGRPGAARAGLHHRRADARHPDAQERRPLHHPPARGDHDPRRHGHDRADAGRGAAPRHGRGHAVHARGADAASSATRSRSWSTASPSSTRSSTARPRRPRPSAR